MTDPTEARQRSGRPWVVVPAVAGAAAYSWMAAGTSPFTLAADLVTILPLVLAAVLTGLTLHRRRADRGSDRVPDPVAVTGARMGATRGGTHRRAGHPDGERAGWVGVAPWVVLVGAVTGWELFCLFGGPRSAYPTMSSMLDAVFAHRPAKALAFFGWLVLGLYLLDR